MKKLLLMVMVGFLLAGCACMQQYVPATSGRVQRLELKVAEINGYTKGVGTRVAGLETDLESVNARLDRTDTQVDQLNTKVNHRYANLTEYTKKIRKVVAEREAKSIYASNVSKTKEVQVYFLGPFATGSSLVSPRLERQLKKLLSSLKNHHLQIAEVDGFASNNTGSVARNSELSNFRALAIADWLKARKVKVDKIRGLGGVTRFGEPRDNRSVVVFARKAPTPTTPAPTSASTK